MPDPGQLRAAGSATRSTATSPAGAWNRGPADSSDGDSRRAPMASPTPPDDRPPPPHRLVWLKRFGLVGFFFFLGKGLLWLTLPALLVSLGVGC